MLFNFLTMCEEKSYEEKSYEEKSVCGKVHVRKSLVRKSLVRKSLVRISLVRKSLCGRVLCGNVRSPDFMTLEMSPCYLAYLKYFIEKAKFLQLRTLVCHYFRHILMLSCIKCSCIFSLWIFKKYLEITLSTNLD